LWQGFKFEETTVLQRNVEEFTRDWNAAHEEKVSIRVDTVPFPEMVKKLKHAAPAGLLPDMAFVDANAMVQLVYGQVAMPLDTLPSFPPGGIDALRAAFVPGAFDTNIVTFRGERHLWGLPAQTTTLALFWNRRMFQAKAAELRAAGLDSARAPRDWDELVRYGKVLTDAPRNTYGFAMNNSLWFTMPFFNQYGAQVVRRAPDGRLVADFASPRGIAALERKANLHLRDGVEGLAWREGALDPDQGFINERYAMALTGPWMIEKFRSGKLDFGVALIPRVPMAEAVQLGIVPPGTDENSTAAQALSAGNVGGQNLIVTARSARPDICLAFALHFTGEKVQREWGEKLGQIPVRLAAQQNLDMKLYPEIPVFIEQARLARPMLPLPYVGMIETEIANPETNLVLQGKQSPEQALKSIDAALTRRVLNPVNEAESAGK
jgi:ABC-type glycerol-3-phosphate transport system substrate-binding protein